jgi:hypothetical protein
MKIITTAFLLSLLCIVYLPIHAQFKIIAEGPKFEEPEEGFAKILQLKNGNTFYIHITPKDGINVRVYDANHKEKAVKTISPAYESLDKKDEVRAIFEMNNDVVLFVNRDDDGDKLPRLHRLIFDGITGSLKKQQIIGTGKYTWRDRPFTTDPIIFFNIRKDPNSDNYAVANYDETEKDNTKRIELVQYGSDHNEINRKFCVLPDEKGVPYFEDMVVLGKEKLAVMIDFYTKGSGKEKAQHKSMMAISEKGKPIYFVEISGSDYGRWMIKYNTVSKKILCFLIAAQRSTINKVEYGTLLFQTDPVTKLVEPLPDLTHSENLHKGFKDIIEEKNTYQGLPQNIVVNDDGSFTILNEEMTIITSSNGNGTNLGTLAISTYDMNGKLRSDYLIPKLHWIQSFNQLQPFYLSERELTAQVLLKGNQYKSFVFINGAKNNYVLFNDTERNNDIVNAKKGARFGSDTRSKLVRVMGITGDCDAFMYKLTGDDALPNREYLFGEMGKGHALALLTISDYNKKNNTYATLMLDKSNTKSKMVNVVWQEPN